MLLHKIDNAIYRGIKMSSVDFSKIQNYIGDTIGINIPLTKKLMVETRLLKRLKALKMTNYDEYTKYLFSKEGQSIEIPRFIDCITTNKTDFFREEDHFDFLVKNVYPDLIKKFRFKEINLWSAAASTGVEAYTIAMITDNYLLNYSGINFNILASDISEQVLNIGKRAVYSIEDCKPITGIFKKRYCLISKDKEKPTVRIKKYLRQKVNFNIINLIDDNYEIEKLYHVIFLRNVMIYFNMETQLSILKKLYKYLHPEGYLFLGHSEKVPESLSLFKRVGPSIYVKKEKTFNG
ncbi:MAG: protein-glutamate O-methyltransferase CheR [Spirochaetaceae bacterium]